jgi:ribosome maturation factor RimP
METLRKELLGELAKVTSPLGFRIVELQAMKGKRGFSITVVIDNGGKVSIQDCERITNLFNARLEVLELLKGADYGLQVSSPGTSRVFKSREEYDIFRGREVRVVLNENVQIAENEAIRDDKAAVGKKKERRKNVIRTNVLDGVLERTDMDTVTLMISGERMNIPFSKISKTRLHE